jgi:hypothetical protein
MTYDPSIPLPGDFLSDSQGDIKNNFTAADNSFGRNHVNFSVVTNAGKHKFVELLNTNPVGVAPVPPLILGEGTLYTKSNAVPESQLFYSPDASGNEYQLTRVLASQFATFGDNVNAYTPQSGPPAVSGAFDAGWTFLPGKSPGLVKMYGRLAVSSIANSGTVKWPITINTLFSLQLTLIVVSSTSPHISTLAYENGSSNTTQFGWRFNGTNADFRGFFWEAIASV